MCIIWLGLQPSKDSLLTIWIHLVQWRGHPGSPYLHQYLLVLCSECPWGPYLTITFLLNVAGILGTAIIPSLLAKFSFSPSGDFVSFWSWFLWPCIISVQMHPRVLLNLVAEACPSFADGTASPALPPWNSSLFIIPHFCLPFIIPFRGDVIIFTGAHQSEGWRFSLLCLSFLTRTMSICLAHFLSLLLFTSASFTPSPPLPSQFLRDHHASFQICSYS